MTEDWFVGISVLYLNCVARRLAMCVEPHQIANVTCYIRHFDSNSFLLFMLWHWLCGCWLLMTFATSFHSVEQVALQCTMLSIELETCSKYINYFRPIRFSCSLAIHLNTLRNVHCVISSWNSEFSATRICGGLIFWMKQKFHLVTRKHTHSLHCSLWAQLFQKSNKCFRFSDAREKWRRNRVWH